MARYTFRKRAFLAPISTGFTSYVFAEVESSDRGRRCSGSYFVRLADCRRCIELDFLLSTPEARRTSLAKIDLLVDVLTAFRTALKTEAQHLTQYEASIRGESGKIKD